MLFTLAKLCCCWCSSPCFSSSSWWKQAKPEEVPLCLSSCTSQVTQMCLTTFQSSTVSLLLAGTASSHTVCAAPSGELNGKQKQNQESVFELSRMKYPACRRACRWLEPKAVGYEHTSQLGFARLDRLAFLTQKNSPETEETFLIKKFFETSIPRSLF